MIIIILYILLLISILREDDFEFSLNAFIAQKRITVYGILALLIFCTHVHMMLPMYSKESIIFDSICLIGNTGAGFVDTFLLLSGYGLVYSFNKCSNCKEFYIKRMKRILPTFIIATIMFNMLQGYDMWNIVSNLLCINLVFDADKCLWFGCCIILFYLLFPILYKLIKKIKKKTFLCILIVFYVFSCLLVFSLVYDSILLWFSTGRWLLRLFPFVIGIMIGDYSQTNEIIINRKHCFISTAVMILILIWFEFYTNGYTSIIVFNTTFVLYQFIGLCSIPIMMYIFKNIQIQSEFIDFMGRNSFEVYCYHCAVLCLWKNPIGPILTFILTMIIIVIYSKIANKKVLY